MRIRRLVSPVGAFLALASFPLGAVALNALSAGDTCFFAAQEASEATGVPLKVLLALTLTETGRTVDGTLQAWPWALNEGGKGQWFETEEEALDYLNRSVAGGTTNIDIGCFQLNYRWHAPEFASLQTMMEPSSNAIYAARLVSRHYAESGDWVAAAGAFHSGTPDVAERYMARFTPIYESLSDPNPEYVMAAGPAPGFNAYPLLKRSGSGFGGSIVPLSSGATPLFGKP